MYLLSPSAVTDFPPSTAPFDSVVVGLAPTSFEYAKLNEAFRLLSGETGDGKKGTVPLIATHKALYFGDKDGSLSLGPGEPKCLLFRNTGHLTSVRSSRQTLG